MNALSRFLRVTRYARAIRFWLIVFVGLVAWLGFGEARAQLVPEGNRVCPTATNCSQSVAYSACMTRRGNVLAAYPDPNAYGSNPSLKSLIESWHRTTCVSRASSSTHGVYEPRNGSFLVQVPNTGGRYIDEFFANNVPPCPHGGEWNPATGQCTTPCNQRPSLPNHSWTGDVGACKDGCSYSISVAAGDTTSRVWDVGGVRNNFGTLVPNGDSCTTDTEIKPYDPSRSTCVATGNGFSECVEPSGRHCVTGAKGGRYCWEPGQTGPRSNNHGTEGASKTPQGETARKPDNMPDATGTQGATTTINNTTTTTTTWVGSGGTPGQGNVGEGGKDPSSGEGDGEGDGPGSVGAGVGGLYESDGKTVESVYNDFKSRVEGSPIRGAVAGFFATPSGGGCPTFTLPASTFWEANTFDHHCSGQLSTVLAWMGYLVLAVAGFFAVRIAIE